MRFTLIFPSFLSKTIKAVSIILLMSYLASCSSPQTSKNNKKNTNTNQVHTQEPIIISADEYLKQAEKALPNQATELLIQATAAYLSENTPLKSLWLSEQLLTTDATINQQYQLHLTSAMASFTLEEFERSKSHLIACNGLSVQHSVEHTFNYYFLNHQLEEKREQSVLALNAFLFAFSLNEKSSIEDINYIWQQISHFSLWQQNQLVNLNAPNVKGWVALTQLTNKHGDSEGFLNELAKWKANYAHHPANEIINNFTTIDDLTSEQIRKIAVIIPLTGKQALAGKTVQEGILAAYNANSDITLDFIDSNNLDFTTLAESLIKLETEQVIGPLLKTNVKNYLALPELNLPTLFLNIPQSLALAPQQVALSMRPEDEAKQAAAALSQKSFEHPVVFSHQDTTSLRIANAFTQKWLELTGEKPEIVKYEQGKKMQSVLKESLSVSESQKRIKSLRYRLRETIKAESRNRRDIDMIYIVGNPLQTRLLKPYIDVNISPFAKLIPVFASSRSHSLNIDESTINDLRGLTFTQIPWLLKSKQQNKALAKTSELLWPKRTDSLQRIFAMGFDSLNLINKLDKMKKHHFIRHYGQTGIIKLGENNILTRSLLWGTYQKNKVSEIAME